MHLFIIYNIIYDKKNNWLSGLISFLSAMCKIEILYISIRINDLPSTADCLWGIYLAWAKLAAATTHNTTKPRPIAIINYFVWSILRTLMNSIQQQRLSFIFNSSHRNNPPNGFPSKFLDHDLAARVHQKGPICWFLPLTCYIFLKLLIETVWIFPILCSGNP